MGDANEVKAISSLAKKRYTLLLRPQERAFVQHFKRKTKMRLVEHSIDWETIKPLQKIKLQKLYRTIHKACYISRDAFLAYLKKLKFHTLKDCFNLDNIIFREVADCFGLEVIPRFVPVDEVFTPKVPKVIEPPVRKFEKPKSVKRLQELKTKKFNSRAEKLEVMKEVLKQFPQLHRVVQPDDPDEAGKILKKKIDRKLARQHKAYPEMKIKNLSKNLPMEVAVHTTSTSKEMKQAMGIPAHANFKLNVQDTRDF